MTVIRLNHTEYLSSAANFSQLIEDTGIEVAFAGRSNAGKSSAINTITGVNGLARTSKTPGRTQLINFFKIDETRRLVDLPGYGYAKVPDKIKKQWEQLLSQYIEQRDSLQGVILLMDIRHPLKPFDEQMIKWVTHHQLPLHILLTKADKLKRGAANQSLQKVQQAIKPYEGQVTVQLFSSFSKQGLDEALQQLTTWFEK